MISSKIYCLPLQDPKKRFLLGKKGNVELLAIGLNPSTANETTLDPTSRVIERIAQDNGCDGWWLMNLCPTRTPQPKNLPKRKNKPLLLQNIKVLSQLLNDTSPSITMVLCCWGNHINDRKYLEEQAKIILNRITTAQLPLYCIGKTKLGNPYHPAPRVVNRFFGGVHKLKLQEFNF